MNTSRKKTNWLQNTCKGFWVCELPSHALPSSHCAPFHQLITYSPTPFVLQLYSLSLPLHSVQFSAMPNSIALITRQPLITMSLLNPPVLLISLTLDRLDSGRTLAPCCCCRSPRQGVLAWLCPSEQQPGLSHTHQIDSVCVSTLRLM